MNQQTTNNYLIVGAGLAGCLIAWRLQQAGQQVQLIGDSTAPSASLVAAGVINPVTGRWAVKSWNIDQCLPAARHCYHTLEQHFDTRIYHPITLRRYCQSPADVKRIGRRLRNPRYADVLTAFHEPGKGPTAIHDPHGSFDISQAAYVDLPELLQTLRNHFHCIDQAFDHQQLQHHDGYWHYANIRAQHVIFCEGAGLANNPFFNDLPLRPIKGETLLLNNPQLNLPRGLYHHNKWLLAYGNSQFRLGATYQESFNHSDPTPEGQAQLLDALHSYLPPHTRFVTVQHLAGLRPSTPDARPLLGQHPNHPNLWLFNGLGSKGASIAPLLSQQLTNHILHQHPLDPETQLTRFTTPHS